MRSARCFVVLAEEGNFRRAAQRLRMAQPHLSRMIQKLETDLGVALLDREKRRFELSNAGHVFLDAGKKLVACAEEGERRVTAFTSPGRQPARVGCDQHALAEFAPLFADDRVSPRLLSPFPGDDPVRLLHERKLHLALMASRADYDGLHTSLVLSEPYMLARSGAGEAKVPPVSLAGLHRDSRLILSAADDSLRPWLTSHSFEVSRVVEVPSFLEALTLVSLGVGTAIVPESYGKLQVFGVTLSKIAEPLPASTIVMAWRDGSAPEELMQEIQSWKDGSRQRLPP